MKTLLLFLVAAFVAQQALAQGVSVTIGRGAKLGLLGAKKFPCSQPDPPKATFGWADSGLLLPTDTTPGSPGGATGNQCVDVCGLGYRLAALSLPFLPTPPYNKSGPPPPPSPDTRYLCRVKYTTQTLAKPITRFLYGSYSSPVSVPSFQNPPGGATVPGTGVCRVYSPEDQAVIEVAPVTGTPGLFDCGCCGTINRDGQRWERGCPSVTELVPRAQNCTADRPWTAPSTPKGALPGTEICVTGVNPRVWGTISPTGEFPGNCFAADPATPAGPAPSSGTQGYSRFCYKINPYSGPPAPDCTNKHP